MISFIKMNLKLLLRNKGFLFFLLVTPALSAFILNVKMEHAAYIDAEDKTVVLELKDYTEKQFIREIHRHVSLKYMMHQILNCQIMY